MSGWEAGEVERRVATGSDVGVGAHGEIQCGCRRGRRGGPLEGRRLGAAGIAVQLGAAQIRTVIVAVDRRDLATL